MDLHEGVLKFYDKKGQISSLDIEADTYNIIGNYMIHNSGS